MFSLVFARRYAMGHRLLAGEEKCALPHGHNETVIVRLQPVAPAPLDGGANMVEPFERAKSLWHRFIDEHLDHALHLCEADPLVRWFAAQEPQRLPRLLLTPGDPTTEMLACCLKAKLSAFLAADGGRLRCAEIRIEETPTNSVIFDGDPDAALPVSGDRWWRRADMSVNDLPARQPRLRAAP
ncbi:MAG TPA: 6-carboxytetrahydropterin synthase [Acetobacteraceae bacterium]|nr:6-carboxytetrahydropterin synthase [Acetobacteraceae bacterium]